MQKPSPCKMKPLLGYLNKAVVPEVLLAYKIDFNVTFMFMPFDMFIDSIKREETRSW